MKTRLILLLSAFVFTISAFGQHQIYLPWEFAGGPPCPVRDVVLHQGTLYAATDCGLYKRPESGSIWEQQPNTPDAVVLFVAANAGAVVAVFHQNLWNWSTGKAILQFFNSTDGGASFVQRYSYDYNFWTTSSTLHGIPRTALTRLYALGDSSFALSTHTCHIGCRYAHLASTDNGQHWLERYLPTEALMSNYNRLSPYATHGDTTAIFNFDSLRLAATSNLRLLASKKIPPTLNRETAGLTWINDRITVAFQNGTYAYTDDLGQHWTTDSLPLSGINDFFYHDNYYYYCANSGFYRSATIGPAGLETLYTRPGPLGIIRKARRGTNGWYLLANAILLHLPDGSNEATPVTTAGLGRADGVLSCLPGRLMFRNEDNLWWRSPDGQVWSVEENETIHARRFQDFYVGDTFCLAYAPSPTGPPSLYRSIDGGINWSFSTSFYGSNFIKNRYDGRVYFGQYFTADGGLTWQLIHALQPTAALGDTLLHSSGAISFDHGQTWQGLPVPSPNTYYAYFLAGRVLFAYPYVSLPVYRSVDFGATWQIIGAGENSVYALFGQPTGQTTWLHGQKVLTLLPPSGQAYFKVANTPFKGTELLPLSEPRAEFGRFVEKDGSVYAARRRGVWRVSDCYTEHPSPTQPVDSTICQGNSVLFHGDTLRTAGTYMQQIPSVTGFCDSTDVLRLQVNLIQTSWEKRICPGDTLLWNGQAYSGPGTFVQQLSTATGCDSSVTLHLGAYATNASINVPLCAGDTLQLNGQAISTLGSYTFQLTGFAGCDSMLIANVYEAQDTFNLSPTICAGASYWHSGQTFTQSGEYWITRIFAIQPCPTTYHIVLTVLPDEVITLDTFVTVGTVIYGQIMHSDTSFTVLVAGPNNCDKIVTINAYTTVGLDNLTAGQAVQAFPNPFRDQLTLRWPGGESAQVRLYDARGQLWREVRLAGPTASWDTGDLPAGLYRVEVRVGGRHFAWKLVKMP